MSTAESFSFQRDTSNFRPLLYGYIAEDIQWDHAQQAKFISNTMTVGPLKLHHFSLKILHGFKTHENDPQGNLGLQALWGAILFLLIFLNMKYVFMYLKKNFLIQHGSKNLFLHI